MIPHWISATANINLGMKCLSQAFKAYIWRLLFITHNKKKENPQLMQLIKVFLIDFNCLVT